MFRHNDVMAHLTTEQNPIIDDPRFQNECYDTMAVLLRISVVKIGSD